MALKVRLCSLYLQWLLLRLCLGRISEKENVTYVTFGTLTHVVFIKSKVGYCSGSLISVDVVLTAAHCLVERGGSLEIKERAGNKDVHVTAGILEAFKINPKYTQGRQSKEIIMHPNFWPGKLSGYDLALIIVESPFIFSDTVFKVELWDKEWPQNGTLSMDCQFAGFGSLVDTPHTRLRMWDVVARHGEMSCPCTKRFQWKRLVCTDPSDTHPVLCKGDSGGALICADKAVAVAHMTRERLTCEHLNYPDCIHSLNTFMYLCPFNNWIRQYVPTAPPTPASCRASTQPFNQCTLLYYLLNVWLFCKHFTIF